MAELLPVTTDPASASLMSSAIKGTTGDASQAQWANWLMNGANTNDLLGTAVLGNSSQLGISPEAAKAISLGIQAYNSSGNITDGITNYVAGQALSQLPMNNEFKKLASVALTGFNPISAAMAFAPEIGQAFGNALGFGANSSVSRHTSPDGATTEVNDNGRQYVIDNTTGTQYPSMNALRFKQNTDTVVKEGYPDNVAQMIVAANMGILPQNYTDQINAQITKLGNPGVFPTGGQTGADLRWLYSITTPGAATPEAKQYKNDLDSLLQYDLYDPANSKFVSEKLKKDYGFIPTDYQTKFADKYKADQAAYGQQFAGGNQQISDIIAKYTAPNAPAPALGSLDALVMGQYLRAPPATLDKLGALYNKANPTTAIGKTEAENVASLVATLGSQAEKAKELQTYKDTGAVDTTPAWEKGLTAQQIAKYGPALQTKTQQDYLAEVRKSQPYIDDRTARLKFLLSNDPMNGAAGFLKETAAMGDTKYALTSDQQKLVADAKAAYTAAHPPAVPAPPAKPQTAKEMGYTDTAAQLAAQAAREKEFADKEAARVAAYSASPEGLAAATNKAAFDAQQAAMLAQQSGSTPTPAVAAAPTNVPGTFTGPGGTYVPDPAAVAKGQAVVAARDKESADREAARIAAYNASPEGLAAAAYYAKQDAPAETPIAMGSAPTPALPEAQVNRNYWKSYYDSHPEEAAKDPATVAMRTWEGVTAQDPAAMQAAQGAATKAFADQQTKFLADYNASDKGIAEAAAKDKYAAGQAAMLAPAPIPMQDSTPALPQATADKNYWTAWYASHPQTPTQGPVTQYKPNGVRISSDPTEQAALDWAYDYNQQLKSDALAADARRTPASPLPMAQSTVQLGAALPMATNPKPPA